MPTRHIARHLHVALSSCFLLFAGGAFPVAAAEDLLGEGRTPAQRPAGEGGAAERIARAEVNNLVREGQALVRQFNDDKTRNPNAIVDAAIVFAKARQLLGDGADPEAIAEVQANLFWCRKQMDLDAVKDYVARRGADGTLALEQLQAVAAVKPPTQEAEAYLARAERYATANPQDHLQIAIRYLEVAEHFPGQPQGTEANKRALASQQALIKQAGDAAAAARQTRFTAGPKVTAGSTPVPSAQAQREAQTLVRRTYDAAFKKRDALSKQRLARKLLAEAPKNKADPAVYHQVLSEAIRLAGEVEDYDTLLGGIDHLAAAFAGLDATEEKRAVLRRMGGKATAAAIVKLLDDPADANANLIAGRWFALVARRWTEGLPMLVLGSDADLAKVALMEIDRPANATERLQVADAWYEVSRKTSPRDQKTGAIVRAMKWYQESVGELEGLAKDRVEKRIAELDKVIPLDPATIEWTSLTAGQWDKLKGRLVSVQARNDRFDPSITLGPKDRVRIVPHPTDTWTLDMSYYGKHAVGWRGYMRTHTTRFGDGTTTTYTYDSGYGGSANMGALMAWIDAGAKQNGGILAGPGRLFFSPSLTYWGIRDRQGIIRVKLVPVDEDEE